MKEVSQELEKDFVVDPETGEVTVPEGADLRDLTVKVEQLPQIARLIQSSMRRQEMIRKYLKEELNRIEECCQHKLETIQGTIDFFVDKAQELSGGERMEYPGLGIFRIVKGREYVDDQSYQAMTPEEQNALQKEHILCFREKTVVSPDKKTIKKHLIDGRIPGFVMIRKPDTYQFKPEGRV